MRIGLKCFLAVGVALADGAGVRSLSRVARNARVSPLATLAQPGVGSANDGSLVPVEGASVQMATHLTNMGLGIRSTGSVTVPAPLEAVWDVITDYERHPEIIPNIVRTTVITREDGSIELDQVGLLSNKLQLKCDMRLAVTERRHSLLQLRRLSGHGFLDFSASYELSRLSATSCMLAYRVSALPCPIFPMPIVENKIRKEVPRMLLAVRQAAVRADRTA